VVIVLAVVGWLVFRGGSPAPAPSASPSKVAPGPQPTPICSASTVVRGTFSLDADLCQQAATSAGSDLFWEQFDTVKRAMVPRNGAAVVKLPGVDFAALGPAQLATANYGPSPIDGSDNALNQLTPGSVLALRTRSGHHAKIRVDGYGYDISLTVVTYP
jgi:hypothetical protein